MRSSVIIALLVGALVCIATLGIEGMPNNKEQRKFWAFFEEAKLLVSRNGLIPKWNGSVALCVYGKPTDNFTKDVVNRFGFSISTLSHISLETEWRTDINDCSAATNIFMWIQQGRVSRSELTSNYERASDISQVRADISEPTLYQSAFAQTGFLSDGKSGIVAILINQISDKRSKIGDQFLEANILEELFHAASITADLEYEGVQRSILEEKFVHTSSIWRGIYNESEAEKYLASRPKGLCEWDIKLLVALYGIRSTDDTLASHKEAYETSTEEVDRKFADTKAAFESSRLFDDKCDHSIEKK